MSKQKEREWTLEDLKRTPDSSVDKVASYHCSDCDTIVPAEFVDRIESPPEELQVICGTRWDGCGELQSMTIQSDGFINNV